MDEGWLSVWNFPNPLEQFVTPSCWEVLGVGFRWLHSRLEPNSKIGEGHKERKGEMR